MVHWNYKQENKNKGKAQIADAYEALQDAPATVPTFVQFVLYIRALSTHSDR